MALIITPGQLSRRSEFYHQLAQYTAAGIGLTKALEQLQRHPPERSFRKPLQRTLDNLMQGATFCEALEIGSQWLPAFDLALLHAGEKSGRLDACFRLLAVYYGERARLAKEIISQLIYPVFLIHFAAFIFFIVLPYAASQFNASLSWLFFRAFLLLSPIYAGTALVIYAGQSKHGEGWRALLESVLHPVPVLGTGRRYLALSRLTIALESLLSAGVNIVEAWPLAASASGSPALRKAVETWQPMLDAGRTPAELVAESSVFPDFFIMQYHTGEISGKLDETLRRLHTYFLEEGTRKIRTVAQLLPRMIYLVVVLCIAYYIISFYSHRYGPGSDLDKILKGTE
jgi:type IV pilus assembly protein PilC